MNELKIISLNVRGLSNRNKRRVVFSWCKRQKADLIYLQETHSTPDTEDLWRKEWGGKIIFSHGKSNARGTCILVRKNLDFEVNKQVTDRSGRLVILKTLIEGNEYILINIYSPNEESKSVDFFRKVGSVIELQNFEPTEKIIMGGDFNCALNPLLDRQGTAKFFRPKIALIDSIQDIMLKFEVQDIWRIKNPYKRSFTWQHSGKYQFSRIDFWLTSSNLQEQESI